MVFIFCQHRHRRIADADSPMFQNAPMLPMSDVQCKHRPNINPKTNPNPNTNLTVILLLSPTLALFPNHIR